MTVRQKLSYFNLNEKNYQDKMFTVLKTEVNRYKEKIDVRHYLLTYDQLIGLFGFYECIGLKPSLGGTSDYIISIK